MLPCPTSITSPPKVGRDDCKTPTIETVKVDNWRRKGSANVLSSCILCEQIEIQKVSARIPQPCSSVEMEDAARCTLGLVGRHEHSDSFKVSSGSNLYSDKILTLVPLEVEVCFKDSTYSTVKDICIDDGASSLDIASNEDVAANYKMATSVLHMDEEAHFVVPEVFDKPNCLRKLFDLDDQLILPEGKFIHEKSSKPVGPREVCGNIEVPFEESLSKELQEPGRKKLESAITSSNRNREIRHECIKSESVNLSPIELPSVICSHVEGPHNDGNQKHSYQHISSHEDPCVPISKDSPHGLFVRRGLRESSFSGTCSISDNVTYTEHPPFSGSISLRSDSSAGSARSFAFPILQTEWTGSPVRMAKADHRLLRKHRGWCVALLCCRF